MNRVTNGERSMDATEVKTPVAPQPPAKTEDSCCAVQAPQPRYRPWLIGAAVLGIGVALYAGWDSLVAAGFASVLIAVVPCLVMCALGLCAPRAGKSKPETTFADIRKTYETRGEPPTRG
jgi:hypothetical protein